jgi:hypothetical protein
VANIDPHKIFQHAEKFYWVLEHLLRGENAKNIDRIAHPAVTISAFTSELYFKCLLSIKTGTFAAGHDLKKLFGAVDPQIRKRIEELWDAHIWEQHRTETLRHLEAKITTAVARDLSWALGAGSHAFEEARYLYEDDKPNLKFILSDLPGILRTILLELQPNWSQ